MVKQVIAGGTVIVLSVLATSSLYAQTATPTASPKPKSSALPTNRPLRIATRLAQPDAFEENGQIVGFSVDLGRSILEQMQRDSVLKPYATVPDVLNAIRSGQADLGIAQLPLLLSANGSLISPIPS